MNILITGGSGFLGRHLVQHYRQRQHRVLQLGRVKTSTYVCDLAVDCPPFGEQFDMVIHAAGKAHVVPANDSEARLFFDINVGGTKNLLRALSGSPPARFVFISSVSVYGVQQGEDIGEDMVPAATDAYGKSKLEAERAVMDWCCTHGVTCIILRLPLLIGKEAPGNLAAMIRAIQKGYYFNVGSGSARRSMLMVEDVAAAIDAIGNSTGVFNLTDGVHPTYSEISGLIGAQLHRQVRSMPVWLALSIAKAGDVARFLPLNSDRLKKLTLSLTFDSTRIQREHGFEPKKVLSHFQL